jgi:hypothetical protein
MTNLPVVQRDDASYVLEPATGEMVPVHDATDRAILEAANRLDTLRREVWQLSGQLAGEVRRRHGIGTSEQAGFRFKVSQTTSWPKGSTQAVLDNLVEAGIIMRADRDRAMPLKPTPDARALKALIGRLTVSHPVAAQHLADAATVSSPSIRDLRETAVAEATESL